MTLLPELRVSFPIVKDGFSSGSPIRPDNTKGGAVKAVDHLLSDQTIARQYYQITFVASKFTKPGKVVTVATYSFNMQALSWCTTGLNKGFGFEIRSNGNILYSIAPTRFNELQEPNKVYFAERNIDIAESIYDSMDEFIFIAAQDDVKPC